MGNTYFLFFLTPCVRFCFFYCTSRYFLPSFSSLSSSRSSSRSSPPACGAVVHSPRTRLGAWISGSWPCGAVVHSHFRASGEAILGTQRYLEQPLYSAVVLLPGQCIVLQYFCFFLIFRLRRKIFFTVILDDLFFLMFLYYASGYRIR